MSGHTPGPWSYYTEPQPNGCPIVGSRGLMVCMLAHSVRGDSQRETAFANARLIAAAPELLEALERINEWCCYATEEDINARLLALQQIGQAARTAIQKATGEQA